MTNIVGFIVRTCSEKKRKKKLLLPIGFEPAKFFCSSKSVSYVKVSQKFASKINRWRFFLDKVHFQGV